MQFIMNKLISNGEWWFSGIFSYFFNFYGY